MLAVRNRYATLGAEADVEAVEAQFVGGGVAGGVGGVVVGEGAGRERRVGFVPGADAVGRVGEESPQRGRREGVVGEPDAVDAAAGGRRP